MAIYPKRKLTRQELLEIHVVCNDFEEKWKNNLTCTIEELIERNPAVHRASLLESLIRSEVELRESSKTPLILSECLRRFPNDSDAVQSAFSPNIDSVQFEAAAIASNNRDTSVPTTRRDQASSTSIGNILSKLGEYEIIDEYARGGMGIIYRARHKKLDRIVALKVILAGQWATDLELTRFQTEAKAIAALEHPNIVALYEAGESDGCHYFSMPMIEGENLAEAIRERPLPPRDAAEITRQIAIAVEYAHQHGIIHRDLKPRNILLDENRKACVSDFGLAKIVREDASGEASLTGHVVGTPAYMAPEQAAGIPSQASDIYSIGAILYTILTGRPPFQAATPLETLRQVQTDEPVAPRLLNALIPRDLETIAMKCLNKIQEARYASAGELAKDLERFLAGKPISAPPVSRVEHFVRWTRRQPVVASLAAAVFVSLVGGIAVSLWFNASARRNEQTAFKNFEFATATVKKYLSDVASSPELKEQGLEPLRKELLRTAQEFYLKLESSPVRSGEIDERLADSQLNLAMISNELGDLDNAQRHFDNAEKAYKSLTRRYPKSIEYPRKSVQSSRSQAAVLAKLNQPVESEKHFLGAIDESRLLYSKTKQRTDQLNLAFSLGELGNLYVDLARADDEKKTYDEVEQYCEEICQHIDEIALPTDAEMLITTLNQLALNQQSHGRFADSEKWFLTMIEVAERQLMKDERSPFFRFCVARSNKSLVMVCSRSGRFAEAKVHFDRAIVVFEQLMRDHPLVVDYIDNCAATQFYFAGLETARRNNAIAAQAYRAAIKLQEMIIVRQPNNFDFRLGMGIFYSGLGKVLLQIGEFADSEDALRKGADSLAEAQRIQPDSTNALYLAALVSNNLGAVYRDQRRFGDAKSAFQKACEHSRRLVERSSEQVSNVQLYASILYNLASTFSRLHEIDSGIEAALESRRLVEELLKANPNNSEYLNVLVNDCNALAELYLDDNRLDESERSAGESRDIANKLVSTAEAGDRFQATLGFANYSLGNIAMRRGKSGDALDYFSQALTAYTIELRLREKEGFDASRQIRSNSINAYCEKARSLWMLGRMAEALAECDLGLKLGQGIDMDGLKALIYRIQIEQGDHSALQSKLDEIHSKDISNLSFDALVDMAASYAMLSGKADDRLKMVLESIMKDFLKQSSKRDPIRFATLKEDKMFSQVSDWSSFAKH